MTLLIVFFQGILSFFSPCVFPLLPVYMSYFSGQKKNILLQTFFFVLGISCTFFLLGLGFTTVGQFFSAHQALLAKISGVIMVLFGLYQFGLFGRIAAIETEHRLSFTSSKMNVVSAFVLGFTFSFAWTPCIGPTLTSVLLMTGTESTMMSGLGLIGVYVLGFIIPFMILGFFTNQFLSWAKKHRNIVKYTAKIGALLLIVLGVMTFFKTPLPIAKEEDKPVVKEEVKKEEEVKNDSNPFIAYEGNAADFTLKDQHGNMVSLSDFKGKVVIVNFWATWCGPCKEELPTFEKLSKELKDEVVFLGVVQEEEDVIQKFLKENELTYPILFDTTGQTFYDYQARGIPVTYFITQGGDVYVDMHGAMDEKMILEMIEQTKELGKQRLGQ